MADLAGEIIRLALYETRVIVPLRTLAPGVYTQRMLTQGNSLLSTVFVESLDVGASVDVRYFDYTTGEQAGEEFNLTAHPTLNTALTSNRITVPRLHDKPVLEITVIGGNVRLGVYVTVVATFATDLDQALKFDGQIAQLLTDKGMPVMLYDEAQGKFFFLRGDNGVIPVSIGESGDALDLKVADTTDPTMIQELIVDTVPAGKTWKLNKVRVVCRAHAAYEVTVDGVIIGSGLTGPMNPNDEHVWTPRETLPEGAELKLRFKAHSSIPSGMGVEAYIMGSELTN